MGFKIASAFVSVEPDDTGFEAKLREQIKAASAGLSATVALDVRPDATEDAAAAVGAGIGEQLTTSLSDTVARDLPPALEEPLKTTGRDSADTFVRAFTDEVPQSFRPDVFGDGLTGLTAVFGQQGGVSGQEFTAKFSTAVKDELVTSSIEGMLAPDGEVGAPIVEEAGKTGREAGEKLGSEAGAAAGDGLGPLLIGAIVGGLAVGAPALLTGVGAVFTAVTAKALASNEVIKQSYAQVGRDAEYALQTAVAPLAPTLQGAVSQVDAELTSLQPTLDGLFANVQPDITAFAGGIDSLVGNALPGLSKGLGNAQVIAADAATSMGTLGTGVGNLFTGLTRDATTTGQGLEQVVNLISTTLGTLGNIAGSASSALSADLMAVVPAADAALGAINKVANPVTVGGVLGALGAAKFSDPIKNGLNGIAGGFLNVAAKAEPVGGIVGKVGTAAAGTASWFEKSASVMAGPWGIAAGAVIGLASGLAGVLISAADATKAVTLNQQDLTKAVSEDGNAAGAATAAYVTATDTANGLANTASDAGVSMATWTQAVLGNKKAHDDVVSAIEKANQATDNSALAAANASSANSHATLDLKGAAVASTGAAAASDRLTDANQKVINSLNAQTKEVADTIAAQTKYEAAMEAVTDTEALFTASLTAAHEQLVANAQASALTTVGSLSLGAANYALSSSLDKTVTAYDEAQAEGNAYLQVLTAMNGGISSLLGSEAAFTTSLAGVSAAVKANGTSLDVNTAKGAANITAFKGVADAADKAAGAVYDNEVSTKGATGAFNDANAKLASEKAAFEQAAEKAGVNKTAVEQLANELYKLPSNVPVSIDINDSSINAALSKTQQLIRALGSMPSGTIPAIGSRAVARATGGPAYAGQSYIVGDGGQPEPFVPDVDGYIYPSVQAGQQAIASHNSRVAANSGMPAAGGRGPVTFVFHGQRPNIEEMAQLKRTFASATGG